MNKIALLFGVLFALLLASPGVARENSAGATHRTFSGLDPSRLVVAERRGKLEVGTLGRVEGGISVVTTPTRTYAAFQTSQPPTDWAGAVFYDVRARETAVVVMHPLTTFHDVLGIRTLSVDFGAFAGATTTTKAAVAGLYVGKTFPLADRVTLGLGLGITGQLGSALGGGFIGALQVHF